jgi:hypothetical protein
MRSNFWLATRHRMRDSTRSLPPNLLAICRRKRARPARRQARDFPQPVTDRQILDVELEMHQDLEERGGRVLRVDDAPAACQRPGVRKAPSPARERWLLIRQRTTYAARPSSMRYSSSSTRRAPASVAAMCSGLRPLNCRFVALSQRHARSLSPKTCSPSAARCAGGPRGPIRRGSMPRVRAPMRQRPSRHDERVDFVVSHTRL